MIPHGLSGGAAWLAAGLMLAILELLIPGVFLLFVGIAAALTGALVLAVPLAPPIVQLAAFTIWTVVAVVIGRRWYRDYPVPGDARLNDPAARLIGETVRIEAAITGGTGRVGVGDGSWPARGPDMAAGTLARVTGIDAGVLIVEPVDDGHRRIAPGD